MTEDLNTKGKAEMRRYFFRASAAEFKKIPNGSISYWLPKESFDAYALHESLGDVAYGQPGLQTSNNAKFVRLWHEVEFSNISFNCDSSDASSHVDCKWFPYLKGGGFRRWYGNHDSVVNWQDSGKDIKQYITEKYPYLKGSIDYVVKDRGYYFKPGISYTKITSSLFNARLSDPGFLFDVAGSSVFPLEGSREPLIGFMNSVVCQMFMEALNPTINIQSGDVDHLPYLVSRLGSLSGVITPTVARLCELSRDDWNSYETSWNFESLPLLRLGKCSSVLKARYQELLSHWRQVTREGLCLERENNRVYIDAYGLQNDLSPEVPLSQITLTCNPHYRYGGDKSEEELEAMLLADTMRELVSYSVGCMLGRYSLDKPGLILANQGETLADYLEQHRLAQVPQTRFPADDDNVIPVLDGDWFADDITLRFRQFLRVAFGDEHYEDNLSFIEQALNVKGKRNYGLREYFLGEFYADHVKRYKKRPIYWLFSSPKGSFNALIYMHRYRPDTVSVVLRYLRDFRKKVADEKDRQASASINPAVSQGDRTRALKETDRLSKVLAELDDYERDVIYPLATQQIEIDLDDGVKVNYLKFGAALKKIVGLEAKDED
jgi:hypothetical protein